MILKNTCKLSVNLLIFTLYCLPAQCVILPSKEVQLGGNTAVWPIYQTKWRILRYECIYIYLNMYVYVCMDGWMYMYIFRILCFNMLDFFKYLFLFFCVYLQFYLYFFPWWEHQSVERVPGWVGDISVEWAGAGGGRPLMARCVNPAPPVSQSGTACASCLWATVPALAPWSLSIARFHTLCLNMT